MKKYLSIFLAVMTLLCFASCGEKQEEVSSAADESAVSGEEKLITYKMTEEKFEIKDKDDRLVFKGFVNYPVFLGESSFEAKANKYFEKLISDIKEKYSGEKLIKEYGRPQEVSYSGEYEYRVSYNSNNIISFYSEETTSFAPGKKEKKFSAAICDTVKIKKLSTEDVLKGTDEDREKLYKYYFAEQFPWGEATGKEADIKKAQPLITSKGIVMLSEGEEGRPEGTLIPYDTAVSPVADADRLLTEAGVKYKGYTEIIEKYADDENGAGLLYDFDGDGVQELIIKYRERDREYVDIYTLKDGSAERKTERYPLYQEEKQQYTLYHLKDEEGRDYISIENRFENGGKWAVCDMQGETAVSAFYEYQENAEGEEICSAVFNGKAVSYEEYEKLYYDGWSYFDTVKEFEPDLSFEELIMACGGNKTVE